MAWPEQIGNGLVVAALLVLVEDHHRDGVARGPPLEDTAQDLHPVRLAAGGHQVRLPWPAPVHLLLDGRQVEGQPGLHAVHDDAHGGPVALAEGDDAEGPAEG